MVMGKGKRVVMAMSGGVDSSVAAALLHKQGYEVLGVALRLAEPAQATASGSSCCGTAGLEDARAVATKIGVPFYALDYRRAFGREVVAPFCEAYRQGRTPNPCALCNARIKFGSLLDLALALDAQHVASGHYARIEREPGSDRPILLKGIDSRHDQSYFLCSLTSRQLAHALFPLGMMHKHEVRDMARELGLPVADKPSSQDICFVGPGGYREFLASHCPDALRPGPIADTSGHVVGRHGGMGAYTVGQRRGLGVTARHALYVIELDAASNTVIVGPKEKTRVWTLAVSSLNWLACDPPAASLQLSVMTRYRGTETVGDVLPNGDGVSVRFAKPHPVSAPGQYAVFYAGDVLVGGGVIRS